MEETTNQEPVLKLTRKEKIRGIKELMKDIRAKSKPGYPLSPEDYSFLFQLEKELNFIRMNKYESKEFVFTPYPKGSEPYVNEAKRLRKQMKSAQAFAN